MQTAHENLDRHEHVKGSSNRAFGFVIAAAFAVVSVIPLLAGGHLRWWALWVAIAIVALAILTPALLALPNRLWLAFGALLHRLVSPVALGMIFYLAVVPTGLVMRLLGKDLLRLQRDAAAKSYWIERAPPGPAPDSLKNQF